MKKNMTFHKRKIWVVLLCCILMMTGLIGRLVYLMCFRSDYYYKKAKELHEREREIKAARGEIVDRNGVVLATNRTVCTISVIHSQIKDPQQTRYIQKKNSQKIVVGITGPFENKYLPRIINEYKEGHETHFDVRVYTFEEGKKLLEAGDIDIAFGLSSEFSVNPDISYETIHQSETCIVCSRKNRLSQYKSINPILVKDEPMITLSSQMGRKFYDDFMKAFILDGFEPNIVKEVNSLSEYFISIKLDEGIGYTGREVVPEEEDLCTVKIVGSHHHADFAVAYLKENKKQSVVQFYEYIVAYFKDYKKNL